MIYYVLLLFFIFDYLRPGSYVPGLDALHLNAVVPIAAILGTLIVRTPVSNREFFNEKNTRMLGVFLGLLVISTLFARLTMPAYDETKNVFSYLLIYWVLVRQIGDVRRLKGVFAILALVHIAVAVLNPALLTDPQSRTYINSGAFLGDGNDFALSVNVSLPLCLFMLLETRSKLKKMFWLAVLLMLVMCVVATQSRGGTVALASIGLYFWWKSPRKVLTASLVVLVVATIFLWAPREYFDRMGMIADTQEGSAQGRIIAWTAGVKMAMANPILGAGAGNFTYAYGDFYRVEDTPLLTAHSIYFLLLGELGLPGLILLLTFIFSNLAANRQLMRELSQLPKGQGTTARNALACTSAALVAYATGGAFLSAAYYPHMYVLSGLLVAARHIVRVQLEQREHAPVDERALEARRARLALRPDGISPEWRPRPALMTGRLEESVD